MATTASPTVREFFSAYLRMQAEQLGQARDSFQTAITLVDHDDLRRRMIHVFDAALDITTVRAT
ncbi:hypothetical protein [Couchioplanes caeruleus]|uniref:hypothetical protein n=1 Tax=Couchioplanes caeruleus TaxID=56438 RepID=UPI00147320CB|nr:hypothetical protein [Couchioplanes caeruleus]